MDKKKKASGAVKWKQREEIKQKLPKLDQFVINMLHLQVQ